MHSRYWKSWATVVLMALISAGCTQEQVTEQPVLNIYDWQTSTPEEQGLDQELLEQAFAEAEALSYYYSLLIVRNGFLVEEAYYQDRTPHSPDPIYSVTKSVLSTLIGMALEMGYIDSLDQKLMDFFPTAVSSTGDDRKENITIRQLLTMQAGFQHERDIGHEMSIAPHMIEAIIGSELKFDPGTDFLYSTHGSHLLSGILTKAARMSSFTFAYEFLFKAMGTNAVAWARDQNGYFYGGAGMHMTPRDMAALGMLYLNKGILDGQRLLPEYWIEESVTNHRSYVEPWKEMDDVGYGYLWWTGAFNGNPIYFASGFGGQWILVVPHLDMVVVSTMNAMTEDEDWNQMTSFIRIVYDYILPAAG